MAERTVDTTIAERVLADVLDAAAGLEVVDALAVESLAYSTLLTGAGFSSWRAGRPRRDVSQVAEPVLVRRRDDQLRITLNNPDRRNAFSAALRNGLLDALAVAEADSSIRSVVLDGNGPAFCSGGDLDEFGTATDLAAAHVLRTRHSVGLTVHRLADRVFPVLHGACIGAGIEIPAFADQVVARPDARFALPELSMGLLPGAGGTVSITRRIGRRRLEDWLRSGTTIDARTALDWGLVDEILGQDADDGPC
jgi:enoyl-CoA hydratase/carnithine racemase